VTDMRQDRLLTPDEVARYLRLGSRWSVYRLVAQGELPSIRIPRKLRIDIDDLEQFIQDRKTECRVPAQEPLRGPGLHVPAQGLRPFPRRGRQSAPSGDNAGDSGHTTRERE